ncbi:hypothetical protein D3C59_36500 [Streptomyces sp. SHP22-7]|nr:hypothetical protein D3C59_36500 [Streptomyces sp. SHP22-7]
MVQRRLVQRARWAAVSHMRPQYPQPGQGFLQTSVVSPRRTACWRRCFSKTRSRYACWASSASPVAFSDQS